MRLASSLPLLLYLQQVCLTSPEPELAGPHCTEPAGKHGVQTRQKKQEGRGPLSKLLL